MPLTHYSLETLRDAVYGVELGDRRGKVLCFSHPDLIVTEKKLREIFGITAPLKIRPDSAEIIAWHKAEWATKEVVDTASFFDAIGFDLVAMDLEPGRGGEIIMDLGSDLMPEALHQRYDIVFDCISHQIFNIPQVMTKAALAVNVGGYAMHLTPVSLTNNGYYNISPCLYADFYTPDNGFEIVELRMVTGVYRKTSERPSEPVRRMRDVKEDSMNVVLAKKTRHVKDITWPRLMTKFLSNPKCKGHPKDLKSWSA